MRVKAKATGVFGKRRKPGETFDIPSQQELGSWMVALNAATKPQAARKAQTARQAQSATKAQSSGKAKPRKQA